MAALPTAFSRGERGAWVTLGAVLQLDGSLSAVWSDVLATWDALLARPWAGRLSHIRRWDEPVWKAWDPTQGSFVRQQLAQFGPLRPYWKLSLADQPRFPTTSIEFQDVRSTHGGAFARTSWLCVRQPLGTPARELFELTRMLCELLPVQQGVAGYLCHLQEENRGAAFDQAWAWARRYYGLHIVDPVEHSWDAPQGLCATNWLTFVGNRWLSNPALAGVDFDRPTAPLDSERTKHGVLVRAGQKPTLGDQNQFDDLSAYTLASQLLEPALIAEPSPFAGMFHDQESTPLWIRRFIDPVAWRDA